MPTTTGDTISCENCGKKYLWKPELAGKSVRCKCGQVIPVPMTSSSMTSSSQASKPAAASDPPDLDALYDLAEDRSLAPARPRAAAAPAAPIAPPISVPGLEDDLYRCPSCSQSMAPGAIICEHCGFNLKTGETVAVKPRAAVAPSPAKTAGKAKSAASAFAGLAPRSKPQIVEDKKAQLLKLVLPVALVLVVIGGIVGYKYLAPGGGQSSGKPMNKDDSEVARLSDEFTATEIHEWFKTNPQRMAGEFSAKQAMAKADELQTMGAKKVLAFGPMMTRSLAVELPDDPDQRKKLIEWENKFAHEHHYAGAKEEGQKYLLLNLGL